MQLTIDYSTHPGFAPYRDSAFTAADVPRIEEIFRQLDDRIKEYRTGGGEEAVAFHAANVAPLCVELKSLIAASMPEGASFLFPAQAAADNLSKAILSELQFCVKQRSLYIPGKLDQRSAAVASELRDTGIAIRQVRPEIMNEVWELIAPYRAELREKMAQKPRGMASCVKSLELRGRFWRLMKRGLKEVGFWDAVSEACLHRVDPEYCALQLSHPHEDWYKDCYADVGLATSDCAYMHWDLDYALIKGMVYLSPVGKENGPFSLVKGEQFWNGSYTQAAFMKEFDYSQRTALSAEDMKATSYYRKLFKFPHYRTEFLKLPKQLQGSSHFGDDILGGSPLSSYLRGRETTMLGERGTCALFSGGQHIHRGGMVAEGERWAFQLGFGMRDHSWAGWSRRVKGKIRNQIPLSVLKVIRPAKNS